MNSKQSYRCLSKQIFALGIYSIVPIRMNDRYLIMEWRNEQIYHLRQNVTLTEEDQDKYFNSVLAGLFDKEQPNQIIFSFLKGDKCIGYGGLVHINWSERTAEISFILATGLEEKYFKIYWNIFVQLIEDVAKGEINIHKIYTYAYDVRPMLYEVLVERGFSLEKRLFKEANIGNRFVDVVIHGKIIG